MRFCCGKKKILSHYFIRGSRSTSPPPLTFFFVCLFVCLPICLFVCFVCLTTVCAQYPLLSGENVKPWLDMRAIEGQSFFFVCMHRARFFTDKDSDMLVLDPLSHAVEDTSDVLIPSVFIAQHHYRELRYFGMELGQKLLVKLTPDELNW